MKIGILQTGHSPEELIAPLGDYDQMFHDMLAGHGFSFDTYPVLDGVFPTGAEAADGWLVTGSKFGAYEDHPWIPPLEDLIRSIHARKQPLVGICFGHQIIAQALGGKVEKFKGGWNIGRTEYTVNGERLNIHAWHQDQVVELPPEAKVIGKNDFCANAFLAYGDHIWTAQPHPEFGDDFVKGLLETRAPGVVPDDQIEEAASGLNQPLQSNRIAQEIADFFLKTRT